MTYQWRKNGIPIPGKTNLTLNIATVSTDDIGAYTVAVTNDYGFVISPAADLTATWQYLPSGVISAPGWPPMALSEQEARLTRTSFWPPARMQWHPDQMLSC